MEGDCVSEVKVSHKLSEGAMMMEVFKLSLESRFVFSIPQVVTLEENVVQYLLHISEWWLESPGKGKLEVFDMMCFRVALEISYMDGIGNRYIKGKE